MNMQEKQDLPRPVNICVLKFNENTEEAAEETITPVQQYCPPLRAQVIFPENRDERIFNTRSKSEF